MPIKCKQKDWTTRLDELAEKLKVKRGWIPGEGISGSLPEGEKVLFACVEALVERIEALEETVRYCPHCRKFEEIRNDPARKDGI